MRKTKRFIAFALAFMMFMSNTISASATAVSSGTAQTGNVTASSDKTVVTDVDNETGGSTTTSGKEDEPSGEDASSQDGGTNTDAGGSSVTDGTPASPEAGSSETGSSESGSLANPSADGSSTEGTSVDGSDEDGTEETTTEETVEETTEEETTEVLEAEKLKGEASDVHTTQQEGDIVSLGDGNGTTLGYFASIAAAIDYADELAEAASEETFTEYHIFECDGLSDGDLTASGDDLVAENAIVMLCLEHKLTFNSTDPSASGAVASSNISFANNGSGQTAAVSVNAGTTLQILEGEWSDIAISFSESEKGTLILGEEGKTYNYAGSDVGIKLTATTVNNVADLEVYAPVEWNSRFTKSDETYSVTNDVEIKPDNLTVKINEEGYGQYGFVLGGSIEAGNMNLTSGKMDVTNLKVTGDFTASVNTQLYLYGKADIANLNVEERTDYNASPFEFYCMSSYKDSRAENALIQAASINISGKVATNYSMWLTKGNCIAKSSGGYQMDSSEPVSVFEEGDTLVTVTAMDAVDVSLLDIHAYGANTDSSQAFCLEPSETDVPGKYALKVTKDYEGIRLYMSKGEGENRWEYEKGFETLTDVKNYINTKNDSDMEYTISVHESVTLKNADDLDYDAAKAKNVSLQLHANKLTVKKDTDGKYEEGFDAVIAVNELCGFSYDDNGNVVSGSQATIDLSQTSGLGLWIKPRNIRGGTEESYLGVDGMKIVSNNSNLRVNGGGSCNSVDFNAQVSGTLDKFELMGRANILTSSKITAKDTEITPDIDGSYTEIANLSTDRLNVKKRNAHIGVRTLNVADTLSLDTDSLLTVMAGGQAVTKNLAVDPSDKGAVGSSAKIRLERQVELAEDDNAKDPSFAGAAQKKAPGTFKVTGTVTLYQNDPVKIEKTIAYETVDDNGNACTESGYHEDFTSGETVATVTNTKIPASYFAVESDKGAMTVERSGSLIKAVKPTVCVIQLNDSWNPIRSVSYKTLEDAVKNMASDFDGSASGRFTMTLLDDVKLSANVTIPAMVQELYLETEQTDPEDVNSAMYAYSLDLNGKTLTTTASVNMNGGVRMISGVAASGKFVINYAGDDGALNINECFALVDGKGEDIAADKRPSVLDNVIVTAKYADVNLHCYANTVDPNFGIKASFDVNALCISKGNWTLNPIGKTASYVKAADAIVLLEGTSLTADKINAEGLNVYQNASLVADQMTLGDFVGIYGYVEAKTLTLAGAKVDMSELDGSCASVSANTLTATNSEIRIGDEGCQLYTDTVTFTGAELDLWGGNITVDKNMILTGSLLDLQGTLDVKGNITSATSRIHISKNEDMDVYGNLYVNDLTINSAYAGDASGDYTLDNECGMLVKGKLTMKAGTLRNADAVEVDTANVKDVINEGSFLVGDFTNTGKLTLKPDSVMLINKSGTVNNVVLEAVDHYADQGNAFLGRGSEATVTINGTFTTKQEEDQLNVFVTDKYLEKIGDSGEKSDDSGNTWTEYPIDWIDMWNDKGTPEDGNDDYFDSDLLNAGEVVLNTGIKTFPVENINVLPWQYKVDEGTDDEKLVDNEDSSVYQSGKELLVAGNCILVTVEHAGGQSTGEPKFFSAWQDAVNYIDTLNNASAVYKIEISAGKFDIGGTMTLPTKASKVVIGGACGYEEDGEWIQCTTELWYQGDITQKTDLTFEMVDLVPYKMVNGVKKSNDAGSTVNTNGKTLELNSTFIYCVKDDSESARSGGSLKAIKGNKNTTLRLLNISNILVNDTITGIDRVEVINGSTLYIQNGGLSVNYLYTENWGEFQENNQGAYNSVYVDAEKGVLEVKETFDMTSETYVYSAGTMKFKNVSTNCEGNVFYTENADSITITGSVYAWDKDALLNTSPYVAVMDGSGENILGYRLPAGGDYKNPSVEGTEKKEFKDGLTVVYLPSYAICVNTSDDTNDILAAAAGVSPSWFITEKNIDGEGYLITRTRKENGKILRVEKASAPVTLYEVKGFSDIDGRITAQLDQFNTLQEAFNEIDKIGDQDAEYLITLKKNKDGKEVTCTVRGQGEEGGLDTKAFAVADRSLKNGKTSDYTFPTKAAEVVITPAGDENLAIVYSKNLTLKTNVTFENVALHAESATAKAQGTIALGSYRLILNDVAMQSECIAFTGSGVAKGSSLIVDGSCLLSAKINNIANVELKSESLLYAMGDIAIGDLKTDDTGAYFGGTGKITVGNVVTEGALAVYTSPKFTSDKKTGNYTKSEPNMTISGSVDGKIYFGIIGTGKTITEVVKGEILSDDSEVLTDLLDEGGAGVTFAKAPNAGAEYIDVLKIGEDTLDYWDGTIYKQSGNLVFKTSAPQVELSYAVGYDEKNKNDILTGYDFETYADAINEINTLKTKRDYTIKFLAGDNTNSTSVDAPVTLTMPKAGMVDTLTLTADDDVYFTGDITLNSNVILEDIEFVQVVKGKNGYCTPDQYLVDTEKYVNPLNIKVNGAYELRIQDEVTFNNALALNGSGKATFTMGEGTVGKAAGTLTAFAGINVDPDYPLNMQGTITNFAEVNLYEDSEAYILPYETGTAAKPVNKPAEVDVTALNVPYDAYFTIGDDGEDSLSSGTLKVKSLNVADSSGIYVNGTADITDACLGDYAEVGVFGQTFNIKGTLTTTGEAYLTTIMSLKTKQSVLNISGKVVRTNPEDKITVGIYSVKEGIKGDMDTRDFYDPSKGKTDNDLHHVYLGGYYYNTKGNTVAISNKLLTAANADASVFAVYSYEDTFDSTLKPGNTKPYGSEDAAKGTGYILSKSGKDILVHYGDEVEAALYVDGSAEVYSYYTSFNGAVAAIDALKDTNAEYTIELLQDVGSWDAYEKVNLPTKAKKVNIITGNDSGIYYNNDLNLGCDTEFAAVGLYPAGAEGKEKGINVKGFNLTLNTISSDRIGKITGNNKEDSVTIRDCGITISGDVSKMKDLTLIDYTHKVWISVTGKVTAVNLINQAPESEERNNIFFIEGKGSSFTNIKNLSKNLFALEYTDLTVTGEIEAESGGKVSLACTGVSNAADMNNSKVNLTNDVKLLTVKNADLSGVEFYDNYDKVGHALWANGAVYAVSDEAAKNAVKVEGTKTVDAKTESISAACLDLTQASAYIDARADKDIAYTIEVDGNITDTCVTDSTGASKLTLPAKDKMKSLTVRGKEEDNSSSSGLSKLDMKENQISFTGDVAVNGNVTFDNIALKNDKDFSFTLAKNSDSKVNKQTVPGESSLTLKKVKVTTTTANGKTVGSVKNITGVNGVSVLTLNGASCGESEMVAFPFTLTGGITKVAVMNLQAGSVMTLGASDVTLFVNASDGEWTTRGKTTIGNVVLNADATLGTTLVKEVPQLTIKGDVIKSDDEKVIMKLYDYDADAKVYKERSSAVADDSEMSEAEKAACYDDTALLIASKADADLFVAYTYKDKSDLSGEGIIAYKDAKNYVYNGSISDKEAIVTSVDDSGNTIGTSYAKTYADAITLINNMGNKEGNYKITLRNIASDTEAGIEGNNGVIKTAVKNGEATYGALALPNANAAASVTITSEKSDKPVTVKYTGTMQPKGTMELTFDDIILTEGKINAKAEDGDGFDEYNTITPALGNAKVTFTRSASTPDAVAKAKEYVPDGSGLEEFYYINDDNDEDSVGLVFTKITSTSGTLDLNGSSAFVIGDANVKNLVMDMGALQVFGKTTIGNVTLNGGGNEIICKNAISIGNVKRGENNGLNLCNLYLDTAYTQKELTKAASQLSITGEKDPGVRIQIYQYCYDVADKEYRMLTNEELEKVLWDPDEKAASYQKLITAPRMSVDNYSTMIYLTEDYDSYFDTEEPSQYKYYYAKVDGNIYLTEEEPAIQVTGYNSDGEAYGATFYSWDQAVKEIDKLNHTDWDYEINLLHDLGIDGTPLKSLNMPSKAAYVSIDADWYTVILTTATNITLKTDTDIGDVQIFSVKKSGSRYYSTPYTINVGKNMLSLWYMWPDGLDFSSHVDGIGYLEPQMKLTGTAQGSVYIQMAPISDDQIDSQYTEQITQITNIGTVFMDWLNLTSYKEEPYSNVRPCTYAVKDGISGVGNLILNPEVHLECKNKDVNVKNLSLGVLYEYDYYSGCVEIGDVDKELHSSVTTPNITVSNTLSMAGSELRAGVSTGSDGKVTLKDIVVYDNDNSIYAKQDKSGKSQIKITGTVTPTGDHIRPNDSAITLGLYYHNSTSRFAQLTDGMVFANAPKAATSMFRVNSAWEYTNDNGEQVTEMNMGFVPSTEIFEKMTKDGKQISTTADYDGTPILETDEVGNPIIAKDEDGNYIQGEDDPHYVLATDDNGDPVFAMDDGGNRIPATDKDGQPLTDGDGNPVYLCVFYETVNYFEDTYGLYRLGNDIVYGKRMDLDWDTQEWTSDKEVRVWIDGEPWETSYLDFATFEEAVKAIDSMGLQKDVTDENGKTTKAYLDYTIQLNRNVEIGNEKQNNKYNALSLPSKASQLTIDGWGYDMTFSGNVTLKCNTIFKNVTLKPVKLVKNELVSDKINLAVGNYKATLENAYFFAVDDDSDWPQMPVNNVTGSAKGSLTLVGGTWLDVSGNVTGLGQLTLLTQKEIYHNDKGEEVTDFGGMWINGNVNVKEIRFEGSGAKVGCFGSLTANMIYVSADCEANLIRPDTTPIKLNGVTSYVDGEGNTIKANVSVVIEESADPNHLNLCLVPAKGELRTGTKVVTGKYLDNTQWLFIVGAEDEKSEDILYTSYMNGSDICVGTAITTD